MGIFDFFQFNNSEEGLIKKHTKRMRDLNAQKEDRQASAAWLADNGSEEAITGLLNRFDLTYEHRMKDAQEKEYIYALLVDIGPSVTQPIRAWVRKHNAFAFPLRLIDDFEGNQAAVEVLLDMLGREVDPFKTEKKRQILIRLADYKDERIVDRVPACLEDFDGDVRYAAAETLISQDTDAVREELAQALANPQEESNRLRVRIATVFHQRNWSLGEHGEEVGRRPPVGWQVSGDSIAPQQVRD